MSLNSTDTTFLTLSATSVHLGIGRPPRRVLDNSVAGVSDNSVDGAMTQWRNVDHGMHAMSDIRVPGGDDVPSAWWERRSMYSSCQCSRTGLRSAIFQYGSEYTCQHSSCRWMRSTRD